MWWYGFASGVAAILIPSLIVMAFMVYNAPTTREVDSRYLRSRNRNDDQ